jgi:hydroxyacyl-ACP dehydratase HTD2-like protein with hotdog domain
LEFNIQEMKEQYVDHQFDEVDFIVDANDMVAFAEACGETAAHFVDSSAAGFRAVPNYASRYHGRRALPKGFPVSMAASFDAGKSVEVTGPIHAGDKLTARSHIHDIFEKTGRSGGMLFIVHRMEFSNQDDVNVSIVDWRMVVRLDLTKDKKTKDKKKAPDAASETRSGGN